MHLVHLKVWIFNKNFFTFALSAGAVEYTDYTSVEG